MFATVASAGFQPAEDWTSGPYFGNRGTFFADVDGDRAADAIIVNDETIPFGRIVVRRSSGLRFGATYEEWTNEPFYGTRGTFFADVTGDGKADAIVVNDDTVVVRRAEYPPPARFFEVSRFTTSALTDVDADRIQGDAQDVLWQVDGPDDLSCQLNLFRAGNVTVFAVGNGIINSQQDFNTIIGLPGRVKVVNQINWCGAFLPGIIGCAPQPGTSQIVVRFTENLEGILWAHEYGHTRDLCHRSDPNAVMNGAIGPTHRRVNIAVDDCG